MVPVLVASNPNVVMVGVVEFNCRPLASKNFWLTAYGLKCLSSLYFGMKAVNVSAKSLMKLVRFRHPTSP